MVLGIEVVTLHGNVAICSRQTQVDRDNSQCAASLVSERRFYPRTTDRCVYAAIMPREPALHSTCSEFDERFQ